MHLRAEADGVLGLGWTLNELCMAVPSCAWHDHGMHGFLIPIHSQTSVQMTPLYEVPM